MDIFPTDYTDNKIFPSSFGAIRGVPPALITPMTPKASKDITDDGRSICLAAALQPCGPVSYSASMDVSRRL